jgi:hypothetical protein
LNLPVTYGTYASDAVLDISTASIDKVATIATLHHFDTRNISQPANIGRNRIISESSRILKKEGLIIVGDVAQGTNVQKYLDAMTPYYLSPNGHPHDFFTINAMNAFLEKHGFADIHSEILSVPWQFKNEKEAAIYLNTCHNAQCTPIESLEFSKRYLKHTKNADGYSIEWQLMYSKARKI